MNANKDLPLWEINDSQYLMDNKFIKVRVDFCTTPEGGKVDAYYVLEYGDWVNCLTIDTDGNAIVLKHYRHAARTYVTELVSGSIDPTDISPEATMRRELEEEAGYTGGTLYGIGTGYPNPATQTNKVHSFLAVGGSITQQQNLEPGETLHVEKMPLKALLNQMNAPGETHQSMHIATLFYAINFIKNSSDPALQDLKKLV